MKRDIYEAEIDWSEQMQLWFSEQGKEMQLCLVAQGYEDYLFLRLNSLFVNGFAVIGIIKKWKKEIQNDP